MYGRLVVSEAVVALGFVGAETRRRRRAPRTGAGLSWIAAACIALFAQAAAATPLTLLSDGRAVGAFSLSETDGPYTPVLPFAPFNAGASIFWGSSFQNTTVSESAMGGTQQANAGSIEGDGGNATSNFSITFQADVAANYTWIASGFWSGQAGTTATLKDLTTSSTIFSAFDSFNTSGALIAGHEYELVFDVFAGGNADASWTHSFQVTAVPEPSTAALVGVGLLGLARRGRRR